MDIEVLPFLLAIIIVAIFLFLAIALTGKRKYIFDKEAYRAKFTAIESNLKKDDASTFMPAVINGDKLLDKAMMEMGAHGSTMADRLRSLGGKFTNKDAVWRAHKLRNALAHESDLEISYRQASNALEAFRQALEDLEAI